MKENFLAYRKTQIEKEKEIINKIEKTEKEKKANLLKLKNKEDHNYFKKDGIYPGMINNIQNKIAYVTLNRKGTINGMIRVEDKQELKKYGVGDVVKVMIKDNIVDEEGKVKIAVSIVPATE